MVTQLGIWTKTLNSMSEFLIGLLIAACSGFVIAAIVEFFKIK